METFGAPILSRDAGADNRVWFRLVTPRRDDFGTNILPEGGKLDRHKKNPVFLWMHRMKASPTAPQTPEPHHVIGRVVDYSQDRAAFDILVEFDVADEFAARCLRKVKDRFLNCVSVGFREIKIGHITVEDPLQAAMWGVSVGERAVLVSEWELYEASLVIVGSNEDALALTRAAAEIAARAGAAGSSETMLAAPPIADGETPAAVPGSPAIPAAPTAATPTTAEGTTTVVIVAEPASAAERAAILDLPGGRAVAHASYGVTRDPWDESAEVTAWQRACSGDGSIDWRKIDRAKFERMFAYVANQGADVQDYKLPHHAVRDGALLTSAGGVAQARQQVGVTAMPDAARRAVVAHLDAHAVEIAAHLLSRAPPPKAKERPLPIESAGGSQPVGGAGVAPTKLIAGAGGALVSMGVASAAATTLRESQAPGNVSNKGDRESMSKKMSVEHRWATRSLIGNHMRTAEGHMHAMTCARAAEHQAFHRAAAEHAIGKATEMAAHLRGHADESDGDEDDMRTGRLSEARCADAAIGDADIRAKYNEAAKLVHAYDLRTAGELVEAHTGVRATDVGSTDRIDARLEASREIAESFKKLRLEQRASCEDAWAAEREATISQLQTAGLMTPAKAAEARSSKWSPMKLGEFKAQMEGIGPIVPIVRQTAVVAERAAGGGAQQGGGGTVAIPSSLQQPAAPTRAEVTGVGDSRVAKIAGETARGMGLDQRRVELRFAIHKARDARNDAEEHRLQGELDALIASQQAQTQA